MALMPKREGSPLSTYRTYRDAWGCPSAGHSHPALVGNPRHVGPIFSLSHGRGFSFPCGWEFCSSLRVIGIGAVSGSRQGGARWHAVLRHRHRVMRRLLKSFDRSRGDGFGCHASSSMSPTYVSTSWDWELCRLTRMVRWNAEPVACWNAEGHADVVSPLRAWRRVLC